VTQFIGHPGYGIAANNPQLFVKGNTQSVCSWAGGNCGACYSLSGPNGAVTVMITDCCAGYQGHCLCDQGCTDPSCDWCAGNTNNHFDLDYDSFMTVCGSAGLNAGNCHLSSATPVTCPSSPVIKFIGVNGALEESSAESVTGNLSAGVIAGIVVGSLVGVILIVVLVIFVARRKPSAEVV